MSKMNVIGNAIYEGTVKPEWIDVNSHMNVAYYVLALDMAVDALWDRFGITNDYIDSGQGSTFAVECHVTYQRELLEGEHYIVTAQILAYDEKRIHQFQRMYHAEQGYLVATAEWMNLHVDLGTRRVSPWPSQILTNLGNYADAQASVDVPEEAGKKMSISKTLYSLLPRKKVDE
ncbi:MAG: thioesterase family protein [Woeseiaceae bacterium]